MSKELKIKIKNVYGNELIYPICDQAKLFAKLSNTKTLRKEDLGIIRQLGYEFKVEQESL